MISGSYRDIMRGPNKNLIYDSGWHKNQIVDQCPELVAALMIRFDGYEENNPSGIRFLRVGSGTEESWDPSIPPPVTTVNLETPYMIRNGAQGQAYDDFPITTSDIERKGTQLTITAKLPPGYPVPPEGKTSYPLREFGLFGRYGGQDDNNFYMINYVKYHLVEKDHSAELIRRIVLEF